MLFIKCNFNVNGREMTNFNSLVFSRGSIWKATYNAEIRTEHFFCQDVFQVLKVFISLASLVDRVQRPDLT